MNLRKRIDTLCFFFGSRPEKFSTMLSIYSRKTTVKKKKHLATVWSMLENRTVHSTTLTCSHFTLKIASAPHYYFGLNSVCPFNLCRCRGQENWFSRKSNRLEGCLLPLFSNPFDSATEGFLFHYLRRRFMCSCVVLYKLTRQLGRIFLFQTHICYILNRFA